MFLDVIAASPHQLREKCILKPQLQKCGMEHVIGFQDNIATVQISICISTFTACTAISASSVVKSDKRILET